MTPLPWATDSDEEIIQYVRENKIAKPIVYVPLNSTYHEAPDTAEVNCMGRVPVVTRRFKQPPVGGTPWPT